MVGLQADQSMAAAKPASSLVRVTPFGGWAPKAIFTIGENGRIASFEKCAENLFGYKAHEVVGREVEEILAEPFGSEIGGRIRRYLRSEKDSEEASRAHRALGRKKNGSHFPLDLSLLDIQIENKRAFLALVRDEIDQNAAEKSATAKEQLLGDYLEVSSDWYSETDDKLRFTYVSAPSEQRGMQRFEIGIGKTRWEMAGVDPETDEKWGHHLDDLKARRSFNNFLYSAVDRTGQERQLSVSGRPFFDANGQFLGYRNAVTDETDSLKKKKIAEETDSELKHISSVLDHATNNLPGTIFRRTLNTEGQVSYSYVGDRPTPFAGLNPQQLKADPNLVRDNIHPDDFAQIDDAVRRSAETLTYYECDYRIIQPDGPPVWYRSIAQPFKGKGGEIVWDGIIINVDEQARAQSALNKSEAKFRKLLDTLKQGVLIHRDYKPIFVNPAFAEMFGFRSPTDVLAIDNSLELIVPEDQNRIKRHRRRRNAGKSAPSKFECRGRRLDGTEIWLDNQIEIVEWDGEPASFVILTDITDRIRKQIELENKTRQLQAILDNVDQGISLFDAELKLVLWNENYINYYGFPRNLVKAGTHLGEFIRSLLSTGGYDFPDVDLEVAKRLERFMASEMAVLEVERPNGRIFEVHNNPMLGGGYVSTFQDISSRKRAELEAKEAHARLIESIESLTEGFVLYDSNDDLVLCNKKYKEFYSFAADSLVEGANFGELVKEIAYRGQICDAIGREEEWISERLVAHRNPTRTFEQELADGRWLQVSERKTKGGSIVSVRTDITNLKHREKAIRDQTNQLEAVFENSNDGLVIFDSDFRIKSSNIKFLKLHGIPPHLGEKGTHFAEIIRHKAMAGAYGDCDVEEVIEERLKLLSDHKLSVSEITNSEGLIFQARNYPMPDGGVVSTFQNITELKKAEKEAAQAHARLADSIESLTEGFALYDAQDQLVLCNKKYWEIYKKSSGPIKPGVSFETLMRFAASRGEIVEAFGREDDWVRERMEAHRNPKDPFERQLDDGRWLQISERKTQEGGTVGVQTEITHLKAREQALQTSEERYSLAMTGATEALWDWDAETNKIFWSPRLVDTLGIDGTQYPTMASWKSIIHPADADRYLDTLYAHLKGETEYFKCDYRVKDQSGHYRWARGRGLGQRDETGFVVRMAGSISDVTKQKEAEDQARQRNIELARIARISTVGEMASALAHEVNQPLAAIRNYCSGLLRIADKNSGTNETSEIIAEIGREAERADKIVRGIRVFVGQSRGVRNRADINEVVAEAVEFSGPDARANKASIEVTTNGRAIFASVYEVAIMQVIINLLRNGIDALKMKSRRELAVTVTSDIERHGKAYVLVAVRDSGKGIPPELETKVFDPFFTTHEGGIGLGLSMCRTIIEAHGGEIWIERSNRRGSEFRFSLPIEEMARGEK